MKVRQLPSYALEVGAIAVVVLTALAVALNLPNPVRGLLVLLFATVVPGLAITALVGPRDGAERMAYSVGISLALCTLGATAMAWARLWHPEALFGALCGMSLLMLGWALVRAGRSSHAEDAS